MPKTSEVLPPDRDSLVAETVKSPPATQEAWVPQLPGTNCPSFYQIPRTTLLPNFHLHALPIWWDTTVTHIRPSQCVWIITYFLRPFSTTTLTTEYTKPHYFLFCCLLFLMRHCWRSPKVPCLLPK